MPERPVKKAEPPPPSKPAATAVAQKKTEPPTVAATVSTAQPAAAASERPSLTAAFATMLAEKKAAIVPPKPAVPVSEEVVPMPQAAPQPTPTASAPAAAIPAENLWPQLLARFRQQRPFACAFLEAGKLVEVAKNVAVIAFPTEARGQRDMLEKAGDRALLEKMLGELTGEAISLKFDIRAGLVVDPVPREEPKPEVKVDPMEAFKNDPLIQKALAEFKAEILPA
jgi:DNA polymerase-3 subunit gamma/tau